MNSTHAKRKKLGLCFRCGGKNGPLVTKCHCQACRDVTNTQKRISQATKLRHRERSLNWRSSGKCYTCGGKNGDIAKDAKRCQVCIDRNANQRQSKRDEVFRHYGGFCCACCGETEPEFLTIDHIHNDGAAHRKVIGVESLYTWLIARGFPSGFQVLCMNCNFAKGKRNSDGKCPHQRQREQVQDYCI